MSALPFRAAAEPSAGPPVAADDRLLVDARELSRLTSLSVRTLRRMDSCGDIPGRVVVRRRVLYRLDVIRQWVACRLPRPRVLAGTTGMRGAGAVAEQGCHPWLSRCNSGPLHA